MKKYLHTHLNQICGDLELDAVSVFLRDLESKKLILTHWAGDKPRESCPFGVTPLGECGESGAPFRIGKVHSRRKFQSEIGVPIVHLSEGHVGVFSAVSEKENFFDEKKIAQIKTITDLIEKNWLH